MSLDKSFTELTNILKPNKELVKDKKVEELTDRIGSRNLEILLNLPKPEKQDILKRLKKMKEIR